MKVIVAVCLSTCFCFSVFAEQGAEKKLPIIDGKWVVSAGDCARDYIDSTINVNGNEIHTWEGSCTISKVNVIDTGVYQVELWCESEGEQNIASAEFVVHDAYNFTWRSKFGSGVDGKYKYYYCK